MTAKEFEIRVQDDHLARIAQTRKPILALAELIWNAVDADATRIDVTLIYNDLDGLEAIEVTDNGHGIPYAQAEDLFSRLGGSWKQSRTHSNEENRILHGKEGRGRPGALTSPRPPATFPAALPVGPVAPRGAHALERDLGGGPPGTVADVLAALAETVARAAVRVFVPIGAAVVALPPVRSVEFDGQDHLPPYRPGAERSSSRVRWNSRY